MIGQAIDDLVNDIEYRISSSNIINNTTTVDDSISELPYTISDLLGEYYLLADTYNPDPYARPGQKKQGRERKSKSRKKPG